MGELPLFSLLYSQQELSGQLSQFFSPFSHQAISGELSQLLLPFSQGELLTSTTRADNVTSACIEVEPSIQNTSKPQYTGFSEVVTLKWLSWNLNTISCDYTCNRVANDYMYII